MANVSVFATLGKGVSVSVASGATAFARSCQVAEEVSTACLAGAIALEQWASSSLSAANQQRLNEMVARTTITVVEEQPQQASTTATTTTTTTVS
mgnify:CR=1 FL=1